VTALLAQLLRQIENDRDSSLLPELWMLLEKNYSGKKSDPAWESILSEELLALRLGDEDKREVLQWFNRCLFEDQLTLWEKVYCMAALGAILDPEALDIALRFLCQTYQQLDNGGAYSVIAGLHPFSAVRLFGTRARDMYRQYRTQDVLRSLIARNDAKLTELAEIKLRQVEKVFSE